MRGKPEKLGVVDVETTKIIPGYPIKTKFWGVTLENEGYRRFERTAQLARFVEQRNVRLYHHHDFDVCQLITDGVIPEDIGMRGGRVITSRVGASQWSNSHALFPDKLARVLDSCGMKKMPGECKVHELPADEEGNHPYNYQEGCRACDDALALRNESDCTDALTSFLMLGEEYGKECGINPILEGYATAASAAFAAAEKFAGPLPVYLDHRDAYRGGRTEAFRVGSCGSATAWDISSSYPASFLEIPERDVLIRAKVTIENRGEKATPFFALNDRSEGLKFPAGTFETWFFASNYERYYRRFGGIKALKIRERVKCDFSWIRRVAPLIETLYRKRLAAKDRPALRYALKIFLNSLYGRLGMRAERTKAFRGAIHPRAKSFFKVGVDDFVSFAEFYQPVKANYLMAAAVTDNARARLYEALALHPTFYCDTDSVYLPAGTAFALTKGSALGAWKEESTAALRIRTVKDYEHGATIKRKGGGRQTIWTPRMALARKSPRSVDRRRKTRYNKRRVLPNGSTTPLIFRK